MDSATSLGTSRTNGVVVRAPRETDAIGGALRGAFGSRIELPDDMRRALDRLEAFPNAA